MKGIIFKDSLFNLVVEGRKTQTRRFATKENHITEGFNFVDEPSVICLYDKATGDFIKDVKPKFEVGETLYLKEPYFVSQTGVVFYKFDNNGAQPSEQVHKKWNNKLFMPENYARYFIEITGVRCERLQDISYSDCFKEGVIEHYNDGYTESFGFSIDNEYPLYSTPQQAFTTLINSIQKGTWEQNPYVWVYDFKLVSNNE